MQRAALISKHPLPQWGTCFLPDPGEFLTALGVPLEATYALRDPARLPDGYTRADSKEERGETLPDLYPWLASARSYPLRRNRTTGGR